MDPVESESTEEQQAFLTWINSDGSEVSRIPWSLRSYGEKELMILEVPLLRKLCQDRKIKLPSKVAHRGTCCRELLAWKDRRLKNERPLSIDLVEEGDSLVQRLSALSMDEVRQLCRERNLGAPGDPLYHRWHCIEILLDHQLRGQNAAAEELLRSVRRDEMEEERRVFRFSGLSVVLDGAPSSRTWFSSPCL